MEKNNEKYEDNLFSMIRHELKNGLNQLVLAEFSKYGNTDRIKRMSEMIDEMITSDYILKHIKHKC
jgi:hypothetical protein